MPLKTPRVLQNGSRARKDAIRLHSDDLIRTVLDRRRPLRIHAQRKTKTNPGR